jgi:hypothetical protein
VELPASGINYQTPSTDLIRIFLPFSMAFAQSSVEEPMDDLVDIRASQINGVIRRAILTP